jgi:hypothetical protein
MMSAGLSCERHINCEISATVNGTSGLAVMWTGAGLIA